jgi:hypothetical protein
LAATGWILMVTVENDDGWIRREAVGGEVEGIEGRVNVGVTGALKVALSGLIFTASSAIVEVSDKRT